MLNSNIIENRCMLLYIQGIRRTDEVGLKSHKNKNPALAKQGDYMLLIILKASYS